MAEENILPGDDRQEIDEAEVAWLDRVLEAESYEEKYDIVCRIRDEITDRLIDNIATVLDFTIPSGEPDERYEQLKYCIRTRGKYEAERFH